MKSLKCSSGECLAGFVMGELSEAEFQEFCDSVNADSAQVLKELERVASLAALAGVAEGESVGAMPDKLRAAVTATGRAMVAAQPLAPSREVVTEKIASRARSLA